MRLRSQWSKIGVPTTSYFHNSCAVYSFMHLSLIFIFLHRIFPHPQHNSWRNFQKQFNPHLFSYSTGIPGLHPGVNVVINFGTSRLGVAHTVSTITRQGIAPATSRAYTSGVCRYYTFCTLFNRQSFPLSELVLCWFVASLEQDNMSYNTIRLYLSAICYHQLLDGGDDISLLTLPCLHYLLRGCHRSLATTVRPVDTQSLTLLRLIHQHWSGQAGNYDIVCMWQLVA